MQIDSEESFIDSLTSESIHELINTAVRNPYSKEKRRMLRQCLNRINSSEDYPYSSDKRNIRKALVKAVCSKDDICTYLAFTVGFIFLCLLSLNLLIRIQDLAAEAYEEIAQTENKPLYTHMPCQTMYYDMEQLLYDYPDLKLPEYIPEGYSFEHADVVTDPVCFLVSAHYFDSEENLITIAYEKILPDKDTGRSTIEADAGSYKAFEKDGILYEQVTNCGRYTIVWEDSVNEFYRLFGVPTEEDAHKIIFSIE